MAKNLLRPFIWKGKQRRCIKDCTISGGTRQVNQRKRSVAFYYWIAQTRTSRQRKSYQTDLVIPSLSLMPTDSLAQDSPERWSEPVQVFRFPNPLPDSYKNDQIPKCPRRSGRDENQRMVRKLPRYLIDRWSREVGRWLNKDEEDQHHGEGSVLSYPPFSSRLSFPSKGVKNCL